METHCVSTEWIHILRYSWRCTDFRWVIVWIDRLVSITILTECAKMHFPLCFYVLSHHSAIDCIFYHSRICICICIRIRSICWANGIMQIGDTDPKPFHISNAHRTIERIGHPPTAHSLTHSRNIVDLIITIPIHQHRATRSLRVGKFSCIIYTSFEIYFQMEPTSAACVCVHHHWRW